MSHNGLIYRDQADLDAARAGILKFTKPGREGDVHDAVLLPKTKFDGWFPLGRPHAIAGASGSGKSTLMLDLLRSQEKQEYTLGHKGAGKTYKVLFSDRGKYDNQETLARLHIDPNDPHYDYLPGQLWDDAAALAIKDYLEKQPEMPDVLFVEGADLMLTKPNEVPCVTAFLSTIKQVCEHYFVSIILSVGSGKHKKGEGYVVQRESIYGSAAWGRTLSGVACLNYAGDETNVGRTLVFSHRNGRYEKFDLYFDELGHLREKKTAPEEETVSPAMQWARHYGKRFTRGRRGTYCRRQEPASAKRQRHFAKAVEAKELVEVLNAEDGKYYLRLSESGSQLTAGALVN